MERTIRETRSARRQWPMAFQDDRSTASTAANVDVATTLRWVQIPVGWGTVMATLVAAAGVTLSGTGNSWLGAMPALQFADASGTPVGLSHSPSPFFLPITYGGPGRGSAGLASAYAVPQGATQVALGVVHHLALAGQTIGGTGYVDVHLSSSLVFLPQQVST